MASPSATSIVLEAVGTKSKSLLPASFIFGVTNLISATLINFDLIFELIPIILILNFFANFKIFKSSLLLPLNDAIKKISSFLIAPREPWLASVTSKTKLEIPTDENVLEILSKIFADLPTPQQMTLP